MEELNIPVILGTAREGRESIKVAEFMVRELSKHEKINTHLVDVADHLYGNTHPAWLEFEETNAWRKIANKADGFVLVIPEYNHSYPGELKLLLDAALEQYKNKPALLCGVSSGSFGGVRALEAIKPTLVRMGFKPLGGGDFLVFPKVGETFNEDGSIVNEKTPEFVAQRAETLVQYAEVMKQLRA